jgi:RNA polymerase sigma factor (sigma-70 family)
MIDEDRILAQCEGMCWLAARKYSFPGYDPEDVYQEARVAALRGIRDHDPSRHTASVTTLAFEYIKKKMRQLVREQVASFDDPLSEGSDLSLSDTLTTPDPNRGREMLLSCLLSCETETERAIILTIWEGGTYSDAARFVGLSRERIRQVKERLFPRIREGVMASD